MLDLKLYLTSSDFNWEDFQKTWNQWLYFSIDLESLFNTQVPAKILKRFNTSNAENLIDVDVLMNLLKAVIKWESISLNLA